MKSLRHLLIVFLSLFVSLSAAAKNGEELSCHADEALQLKQAPHGAKRLNKHSVEIGWRNGSQIFTDKPPYTEFGGTKWTYCGYNANLKMHLLEKTDESLFTGVMLDDVNGVVLPAGLFALFSLDLKHYLAYEQEDGRDGETIKLYRRDGTLEWEGYNGVLGSDNSTIIATFDKAHWNEKGKLQVTATCLDKQKTETLTLVASRNGQWQWLPKIDC